MICKAKTVLGDKCRNKATTGSDYCHVHSPKKAGNDLWCSFCGTNQKDVFKLIAGPAVYICDTCIDLCVYLIWDEKDIRKEKFLPKIKSKFGVGKRKEIDIKELGIKPRFNKVIFDSREKHCFYLCPFCEPFNSIYNDHVKPIVLKSGFSVDRADEIFGTQPIIEDIWESINSCELVLADVTGKNPNVMYEIGMAHTVGKPVIIITQNINDVPFDLKHYRCIIYSYTPKGIKNLENKILGTLKFFRS